MSETPQYRVLEPAFFAPDLIQPGSIIATDAPPGPHLEPWNEAAKVRMEAWLTEEYDELDPKTKLKTGAKVRPHEQYRRTTSVGGVQQTAQLISAPEPNEALGQTLAELTVRKSTDQRPGPSRQFKTPSPVQDDTPPPTALVVKAAPKDTTVTGGPG